MSTCARKWLILIPWQHHQIPLFLSPHRPPPIFPPIVWFPPQSLLTSLKSSLCGQHCSPRWYQSHPQVFFPSTAIGVSAVFRRCCVSKLPPEHHNTTSIACSDYMLRGKNVGGSQVSSPTLWRALYVERDIDKGIVRYHFTSVIHCHGRGQGIVSMTDLLPPICCPSDIHCIRITSALSRFVLTTFTVMNH
ncbi:hypothetical protein DFH07DRAFT_938482 [Mycena maculata]|uniref:Uncharacterized protein n=1 Tax=Mycena maculata TaxID=230809 RepID=A0AAD7JAV6_9AGAR|nr:hypothetical protein DFH07DRAFT_947854 [Mycena maculata]KAJ7759816.1 hypothetical protein DFH07DRAFT_940095 [Mycena maculata]KAJ7767897.1 hypothetical protein DFH07DRAFT_938482 [Mycena maculata]